MKKIKLGINGFGRIGRCVAHIAAQNPHFDLVAINDIDPDLANLSYLYNYDSTYGRPTEKSRVFDDNHIAIGDQKTRVFCGREIENIAWNEVGCDIVVDSSGVSRNIENGHLVVKKGLAKKVIVTQSPSKHVDHIFIMGINDNEYSPDKHHVVGSSICDANAIAHVLVKIEKSFGIESGFITSLHPWLSYQNLVDAPLKAQSNPGHFWKDYSLGRASVGALIPKNTTAVSALTQVLPEFKGRLDAFSYRVPTSVVTSADMTLITKKSVKLEEVKKALEELAQSSPYVTLNRESLVSRDYEKVSESAVIDDQWTKVLNDRVVKIIVWYDNEWGYSARVVDLAHFLAKSISY